MLILLTILAALILCVAIIVLTDPYGLFSDSPEKRLIPYYTWHHYNLLKKYESLDVALLGSSAINYYSIDQLEKDKKTVFVMGVESSNITEHLSYGGLLLEKKPEKIIFFYTFYSLNPSRGFQEEFKKGMIERNNRLVDVFHQYLNVRAFKDTVSFLKLKLFNTNPRQQIFYKNGLRTQLHYLARKNYDFNEVIGDYFAAMSIDPHYYNSRAFQQPESILSGFEKIMSFKKKANELGITVQFVATPVYRQTIALVYHLGLGKTYERYRLEMAKVAEYQDLNLDLQFTGNSNNWWDSHHTRNGGNILQLIESDKFRVDMSNVETTMGVVRPSDEEIQKVIDLLESYPRWEKMEKRIADRLKKIPPLC